MGSMKNWLKKVLPPPVNSFMREINRIVDLEEKNQATLQQLMDKVVQQENLIQEESKQLKQQNDELKRQAELLNRQFEQLGIEQLKEQQEIIQKDAHVARNHAWRSQKNTEEILWAEIFNNAISDSTWLINKSFSAGRWAVGYQYLYAVYRILNEVQPKKILELGLGQSTRLLGQYAASNPEVVHTVVEHDSSWIEFFQKDFELAENSHMLQLERGYRSFKEDDKVLVFMDFKKQLAGQKFDFISIDAPFGGEASIYARVDILDLIPECLEETFIIVVDDYNRQGEKNMVAILEELLHTNKVAYAKGIYSGKKDCVVICSENMKFICSM